MDSLTEHQTAIILRAQDIRAITLLVFVSYTGAYLGGSPGVPEIQACNINNHRSSSWDL